MELTHFDFDDSVHCRFPHASGSGTYLTPVSLWIRRACSANIAASARRTTDLTTGHVPVRQSSNAAASRSARAAAATESQNRVRGLGQSGSYMRQRMTVPCRRVDSRSGNLGTLVEGGSLVTLDERATDGEH